MLKKKKILLHSNGKWEMICLGQERFIHYSRIQLGPLMFPMLLSDWWGSTHGEVAIRSGPLKGISVKGSCCASSRLNKNRWSCSQAAGESSTALTGWRQPHFSSNARIQICGNVCTTPCKSHLNGTPESLLRHRSKGVGESKRKPPFSYSLCN